MRRLLHYAAVLLALGFGLAGLGASPAQAAGANLYVSGTASATVGNTVTVDIYVNTNGQSANSFDATISYPANLLTPVRGATGAVCNLYVSQPDPTQNPDEVECGKSNGFTGTGSIGSLVFTAAAAGSGSFGLSGCQVLANDGSGTDITGGCSGSSISISAPATPVPATPPPAAVKTATTPKATAKATSATQTPTPAEVAHTPVPTVAPTPPPVQALPSTSAAAPVAASTAASSASSAAPQERRTIGQAFGDFFGSFKEAGSLPKSATGGVALLALLLPILAIACAILFLLYRLAGLEKRRRRTLDRLFEMELTELSALEGKMDLLAEKGTKGRDEYKEEFEKAKANILREIHPDYGKAPEA